MSFFDNIKKIFKPIILETEIKLEVGAEELGADIKEALDQNEDKQLGIDDIGALIKKIFKIDRNQNGKIEFWEYVTAFFYIYKLTIKIKEKK